MDLNNSTVNSQSLLSAVLKTIPAIVAYCDRDWVYQYVNENYESWFGIKKENLIGKSALLILGEVGAKTVRPLVDRCLKGEVVSFEKEVHYEKIGLRYVRTNYVPEKNSQGEVIGFFIITYDLSSEHEALKNLREKNLETERMLDCIPMMIGLWDKDLLNVEANQVYREYFGKTKENIKGKHIRELLGEDLFVKNLPFIEKVLAGKAQYFERDILLPNGEVRSTLASYIPNVIDGETRGFFVLVTDVSEIKKKSRDLDEQRKFYSEILNSIQEGFVVQDENAKIIYFNESASTILGLTHDQLLGKTSYDPDWRALKEDGSDFVGENHPAIQTIKTGKPTFHTLMGLNSKKESTRWISINSFPFYGKIENQSATVLCTFADVTEKFGRDKLIRGVIENSPGIIYQFKMSTDQVFSFPYVSNKVVEVFEMSTEEFMSDSYRVMNMVVEEEREQLFTETFKSAEHLSVFEWKGRIRTANNHEKWINIKSIPHREHDGSIVWDGLITDVTDEVALLNELSQERARAAHAAKLASLGELSAGVAHEINNPLSIIQGLTQVLRHSLNDPEKFQEKVTNIHKSVQRISKIVNGLKRFSRIDIKNSRGKYNVQDIFNETLPYFELKARQDYVELTIDIAPDAFIECDPLEIEQVIINLINNAIDAVKNLEIKWVKLKAFYDDQYVYIHVTDSGKGIPSSIAGKMFDPFFTTKEIGKGTGLGLSLSSTIIKDHGGIIYLDHKFPHTRFEIRLPRASLT